MKKINRALFAALCAATVAMGQGSLTPPGAPAPTMKTLDEIDANITGTSNAVSQIQDETRIDLATVAGDSLCQHVITNAGSYYLSGNLELSYKTGVKIDSSDVTLDLNGFTISLTAGGGDGISISGGKDRVVVRNGSVTGFEYGIRSYSSPSYPKGCLFEKLTVSGCIYNGIFVGEASRLIDCCAHDNAGTGISAAQGSTLSGCSSYSNAGTGIFAGRASTLSGCTASKNSGDYGIYAGDGSTISGCTASYNSSDYGIYANSDATLSGCTANDNTGSGASSYGILIGQGSTVIGCTASYNSNTNSSSTNVQGGGILIGLGSTVKNCTTRSNRGDGIRINLSCYAKGNNCDSNGNGGDGAGIHATGYDNRIDGNQVTFNDRGIDVDSDGNFITRNTASRNATNWEIASSNVCFVISGTTSGAISGDSGGTAPGSTDPNANFTY